MEEEVKIATANCDLVRYCSDKYHQKHLPNMMTKRAVVFVLVSSLSSHLSLFEMKACRERYILALLSEQTRHQHDPSSARLRWETIALASFAQTKKVALLCSCSFIRILFGGVLTDNLLLLSSQFCLKLGAKLEPGYKDRAET